VIPKVRAINHNPSNTSNKLHLSKSNEHRLADIVERNRPTKTSNDGEQKGAFDGVGEQLR
jgi:hypothetical protein